MSQIQYWQESGQWQELEEAGQAEAEWRNREDIELERQERQDEEQFCRELEEKFPILRSWPQKEKQ